MDFEEERSYGFKFIPDAQLEMDDAVAYYVREANIKVANDFLTNVEAAVEMIAMWPDAGHHVPELPEKSASISERNGPVVEPPSRLE